MFNLLQQVQSVANAMRAPKEPGGHITMGRKQANRVEDFFRKDETSLYQQIANRWNETGKVTNIVIRHGEYSEDNPHGFPQNYLGVRQDALTQWLKEQHPEMDGKAIADEAQHYEPVLVEDTYGEASGVAQEFIDTAAKIIAEIKNQSPEGNPRSPEEIIAQRLGEKFAPTPTGPEGNF